jgi:hypothetical protein
VSDSAELTDEEDECEEVIPTRKVRDVQWTDINSITGMSYTTHANERLSTYKAFRRSHTHLDELVAVFVASGEILRMAGSSTCKACDYVFSRAYDLRSHLRAEHRVHVERERVDELRGRRERLWRGQVTWFIRQSMPYTHCSFFSVMK